MAKSKEVYDDSKNNFASRLRSMISEPKYVMPFKAYLTEVMETCTDVELYQQYEKALKDIESRGFLTPEHITVVTGRNKSNVSRWISKEGEDLTIPNVQVATRLAKAFGVTTDYLLGIDATSDRTTAAEADVLKKYGIDPESFLALQAFHDIAYAKPIDEHRAVDYDKAIAGLNLLLQQQGNAPMDILSRIGYFLTQRRFDNYFYFDSGDVDDLFSGMFESIPAKENFNEEHVKQCLKDFVENSPQFPYGNFLLLSLDVIKDALRQYKEQRDPNFFTIPDRRQFFKLGEDSAGTDE